MHAQHFADQLRILGGLEETPATERVLNAFREVPREDFTGPGPWLLRSALAGFSLAPRQTLDADPRWLYHSVLVVLDEAKGINIGDPSLWARNFAHVDIQPGSRILQVGAGVGYYSAILRHLAGPDGLVVAYEVEEDLAARAAHNLRDTDGVELRHGDAAAGLQPGDTFDYVIAFAGVTHVPAMWSAHLAPDARLLLPLTGPTGWGAMILAQREDEGFAARTLGSCGFYPCQGARRDDLAEEVKSMLADPNRLNGWHFRMVGQGDATRFEPGPG